MKAVYLTKYGNSASAFQIRETETPKPAKGEVLIKVACFGLNFADVVARRGLYPEAPKNPAILGYDVGGTIAEIGEGVQGFHIGQRVTALTRFGGYAEYAATQAMGVAPIPDSMDFATATALATQGCTAYYCAFESVVLHKGDRVLIHAAAGGVGGMLVQMAKSKGCIVYGTASGSKMDYLKQIGVDVPIDYTKEDFTTTIKKHSPTGTIDVVFDSLGGRTFKNSYKLLAATGRIVTFGAAEQINGNKTNKLQAIGVAIKFGIFSPIQLLMASKAIIGVNMLQIANNRQDIFNHSLNEVIRMVADGSIIPKVDKVFNYKDIVEAHDYLESRKSIGKVVVSW
jgi:NADPH:quinone reductase-like Zn-dependent oxidoreductase